ncbi:Rieske (2Fe-2S) protein [Bailinhaonella thermotolerans]|uniref:Cytochrome bc1 complex Rieske iron-sulfur subunit n=1 Tax=Bailinhaonella thermotolerans TaxID=1070861 RepID=A0A3A4BDH3_9ACTN|nr:Rieske (2Fe-2S) protein [Bailinhaonella thermotolerans]RJL36146.1 Rieske (2Fe-2S) protein [Bailinhaonella thermotolerans]
MRADDADRTEEVPAAGRRAIVLGIGAAGATALTACAGYGTPPGDQAGRSPAPPQASPPATGGGDGAGAGGDALARAEEIPVGGGKVFQAEKVVVTQPAAGDFKAFSAVCTHRGCTVGSVEGGTINCPCHGSKYKIADGSVAGGPAPDPLPEKRITVQDGRITLA